jgi:outer membrane lipoprotein-sorting protein
MFGFGRALESLISVYRKAQTQGDLKTAHTYAKVGGRKCIVLMRYLPAKDDYPACKTFIYIDVEYLAPIRIEAYDWDGRLQSLYDYRNIKFNVGLSEDDFTPQANGIAVGKTP